MKYLTSIILLIIFSCFFSACTHLYDPVFEGEEPDPTNYYRITESETIVTNGITYSVDSKYEAYCVLKILTGDTWLMVSSPEHENYAYYQSVVEYFDEYSNSDIVKRAEILFRNSFSVDIPPSIVQVIDEELAVRNSIDTESYEGSFNGWRGCLFFIEILQDFCHLTDFNTFYEEHREYYRSLLDSYVDEQSSDLDLSILEDYCGYIEPNNHLILEPLHKAGNFGIRLENTIENSSECYMYIRPREFVQNIPVFYSREGVNTLFHEFSHTYINRLVDVNWEYMEFHNDILQDYDFGKMSDQGYGDPPKWRTLMYEEFTRALAARLTYAYDQTLGLENQQEESDNGFILNEILTDSLLIYEDNRGQYEDIDAFFSTWMLTLEEY